MQKLTDYKIKKDPNIGADNDHDHNGIHFIIKVNYGFKIFKLLLMIINITYFIALFWYIYSELGNKLFLEENDFETFNEVYGLSPTNSTLLNRQKVITLMYFIYTTLSTVGFGDLRPQTSHERIFSAFLMLLGTALFSLIMG